MLEHCPICVKLLMDEALWVIWAEGKRWPIWSGGLRIEDARILKLFEHFYDSQPVGLAEAILGGPGALGLYFQGIRREA